MNWFPSLSVITQYRLLSLWFLTACFLFRSHVLLRFSVDGHGRRNHVCWSHADGRGRKIDLNRTAWYVSHIYLFKTFPQNTTRELDKGTCLKDLMALLWNLSAFVDLMISTVKVTIFTRRRKIYAPKQFAATISRVFCTSIMFALIFRGCHEGVCTVGAKLA